MVRLFAILRWGREASWDSMKCVKPKREIESMQFVSQTKSYLFINFRISSIDRPLIPWLCCRKFKNASLLMRTLLALLFLAESVEG